jgi:hypothetical protein
VRQEGGSKAECGHSSERGVGWGRAVRDANGRHGFRRTACNAGEQRGCIGPYGWRDARGMSLLFPF